MKLSPNDLQSMIEIVTVQLPSSRWFDEGDDDEEAKEEVTFWVWSLFASANRAGSPIFQSFSNLCSEILEDLDKLNPYLLEEEFFDALVKLRREDQRSATRNGRAGGLARKRDAADRHSEWQATAKRIWSNDPELSLRKTGKRIADTYEDYDGKNFSGDHIRKHIHKHKN